MIKQEIKQGENIIRIETAEDLEDAKKNKFKDGEYSRFFLNNKKESGYMDVMKFIISKTKENNQRFIPDRKKLSELREKSIQKQNEILKEHFKQFRDNENNQEIKDYINEHINKIDEYGVRIKK